MFSSGTQLIKNKGYKKYVLVIGQSAKNICFNYSTKFEIMTAVTGRITL